MKFLETITPFGDNILIPTDRIKYISIKYTNGWGIHIVGDGDIDLCECFGDNEDRATSRYEQIKKIIQAK